MADQPTPIFDIAILHEQYAGMPIEMQGQALQLFLSQGAKYCQGMCDFAAQPQHEVFRCYHSLKTMSAMVGASKIKLLCIKFEQAKGDAERQAISEQLKSAWQQTEQAMQPALTNFSKT